MFSRKDETVVTSAEWVYKDLVYWLTVTTSKTGNRPFYITGVERVNGKVSSPYYEEKFAVGNKIAIGNLGTVPSVKGILAYFEAENGVVFAGAGLIDDNLSDICQPLAYITEQVKTRNDLVAPTKKQVDALKTFVNTVRIKGLDEAISQLEKLNVFDSVWASSVGCPASPTTLPEGVYEIKPKATNYDIANQAIRRKHENLATL